MTAPMQSPFGKPGGPAHQPIPQVIYNPDLNATLGGIADHLIFQSASAMSLKLDVPFADALDQVLANLEHTQDRIPEWVQEQRAKLQAQADEQRAAELAAAEAAPSCDCDEACDDADCGNLPARG